MNKMSKLLTALLLVATTLSLTGCLAAAVGGGFSAVNAKDAQAKPSAKKAVIAVSKTAAFNAALKALTATGRSITSQNLDAGVVQGKMGDNVVSVNLAAKSGAQTEMEITVSFIGNFALSSNQHLDTDLTTLWNDIETVAKEKSDTSTSAGQSTAAEKTATKKKKAKATN